jgi:hypothetical protein
MHHRIKHVFQIDNNPDQEYEDFFVQFDEHVDQNRDYRKRKKNEKKKKNEDFSILPKDRFE